MPTIAEKVSSGQARKTGFAAWLGEFLRQILLFPAMHIFVSIRSIHTDQLAPEESYIFAANHSSHLDAPSVLAALPLRLRMHLSIAAAADYFFAKYWKGVFVGLILNAFPFERKRSGCAVSLAYTEYLLRRGRSLLIFPEGTRSRDGQIQHFKRGIGQIANHCAIKVIPTWIEGTYAALPKGARWPHRQAVVVTFGKALCFSENDDPSSIAATVECAVRALARTDSNIECE
jgi:1-acyl-sn-glycerol-3-phosphate acyltransferase